MHRDYGPITSIEPVTFGASSVLVHVQNVGDVDGRIGDWIGMRGGGRWIEGFCIMPAKGLVQRGLMRLDTSQHLPRLFFTEAGLAELRTMMADRRFACAGDQGDHLPCSCRGVWPISLYGLCQCRHQPLFSCEGNQSPRI